MTDSVVDPVAQAWQTAGDAGNVLLAAIAVFLLWQGLADRRRDRESAERVQASRVHLSVQENFVPAGPNAWSLESRTLRVRNDSDLPVTLSGDLTLHQNEVWFDGKPDETATGRQDPNTTSLRLSDTMLRPGQELEIRDVQHGWDYAVLRFSDAVGTRWVRVSSTGLLVRESGPLPVRCRVFQFLAQVPGLRWLLETLPRNYLVWRFKRRPGVPTFARVYRWFWGSMPIGEPDPWTLPQGADAKDWPYEGMLAMGRFERQRDLTVTSKSET